MSQQDIAISLEHSVVDRTKVLLSLLPKKITNDNLDECADVCKGIEQITSDAYAEADSLGIKDIFSGWRRVLIPYWSMSYEWPCKYKREFTWADYLEFALECGCNKVELFEYNDTPSFGILDKSNKLQFVVALEKENS